MLTENFNKKIEETVLFIFFFSKYLLVGHKKMRIITEDLN
jgi:hypothetical protein